MTQSLVRCDHLSKRFDIPGQEPFLALDDVTFDLEPGQSMCVVGPNGAGKSTLLRVLAGITAPTEGRVDRVARTATLIELSAAFEPELTGRENLDFGLALNGVGFRRRRRVLGAVAELSGIEEALDTPVKWYSDGMRARLAVSIALHSDPELLLIDEVLAVGDHRFQRQAVTRVRELVDEGAGLILVTHDPMLATAATDQGLWLDTGRVVDRGPAGQVVADYSRSVGVTRPPAPWRHTEITRLVVTPEVVQRNQPVGITLDLLRAEGAPDVRVTVELLPPRGDAGWWMRGPDEPPALRTVNLFGLMEPTEVRGLGAGLHTLTIALEGLPITPPAAELAVVVLEMDSDLVVDEGNQEVRMEGAIARTPVLLDVGVSEVRFSPGT